MLCFIIYIYYIWYNILIIKKKVTYINATILNRIYKTKIYPIKFVIKISIYSSKFWKKFAIKFIYYILKN